ncbi:MAG: anti-sigma F factor [Clostridia bacterium]|nr:anti-sigma F factor [Clostridia bacterium]MBQ4322645.1 anti-sigma F factor [Clostridia bacterium]
MKEINQMTLVFEGRSVNESFARVTAAAFLAQLDPTLQEIAEIKTVVSEAVTNCIVHGYEDKPGAVRMKVQIFEGGRIRITVSDKGKGIPDIPQAMTPCFTTGNEDRAGMGFSIMQGFSDKIRVRSFPGRGTTVVMEKYIGGRKEKTDA